MTAAAAAVDVHAHWLPQELFDLPPGSPLPPMQDRGGQLHLGDLPLSIATEAMSYPRLVLADMQTAEIDVRVLSAPPFAFPIADAPGVDEYVATYNEALRRVCRDSDGRLLGLGLVSLHDAEDARRQLDAIVAADELRGIAVPPLLRSTTFDDGPLRTVVELAAERDLAVLVHPMQLPRPEWPKYYLANLIGNPVETATAVAALILGGVLEDLPELRICLLHGGGCAPALLGRWTHGWHQREDVRAGSSRPPAEGFRDLWFDTLSHDAPTLQLLMAHADHGRVMTGSDYPFDMGTGHPLDVSRAAGLADGDLGANARRFLGLGAPDVEQDVAGVSARA